ncbi:hypothetical protein [Nonomuraea recticatena]|uniref:hypothetical protein n=1 Tax=Nonomuraea recticatena TaxID=46178 RepID=UPI00361E8948
MRAISEAAATAGRVGTSSMIRGGDVRVNVTGEAWRCPAPSGVLNVVLMCVALGVHVQREGERYRHALVPGATIGVTRLMRGSCRGRWRSRG